MDHDQDLDVLYSSPGARVNDDTGAFALFRNQGNGTLGPLESFATLVYTGGFNGIAAVDLNADGWVDVVGSQSSDRVTGGWSVALGNGSGSFLPTVKYMAGQTPSAMTVADVDRDNDRDVVVTSFYSLEATVHLNRGNGVFGMPAITGLPLNSTDLEAADIDLDGDLDIATSGGLNTGVFAILKNRGNGTFDPYTSFTMPNEGRYIRLVELNGPTAIEGPPDLLWAGEWPYDFYTRENLGDGTFAPVVTHIVDGCGFGDINAYDVDGDGDRDVCITEDRACLGDPNSFRRIYIAKNRGNGTFDDPTFVITDPGPYGLTAGDFNRDQKLDLATAHWGPYGAFDYVDVLIGHGDGTFEPADLYTVGQGPHDIVAADLDSDQILDLATCNTGNDGTGVETMSVMIGRGDGTFLPAVTYPGSYSPDLLNSTEIVAGDVDQDGAWDLMVSNYGSNDISFYRNRGNGTFEPQIRYGAGGYPFDLAYGDFTGDGIGDLAVKLGLHPSGFQSGVAIMRGIDPTTTAAGEPGAAPRTRLTVRAAPNPARGPVRFAWEAGRPGAARLRIYDVGGRLVRALEGGAGSQTLTWDARVAGGVYFYELEASGARAAGKIQRLH